MFSIQSILFAIFNAYILYNILSTKGPKYAFYFLFIWDMIYMTINFKGSALGTKYLIIVVLYIFLENMLKVYLNNYFFKRVNTMVAFIAISMMLEIFTNAILGILISSFISII